MILNLTNPIPRAGIELEYKVSSFPDGQQSIELTKLSQLHDEIVEIRSRLNSFKDLELIICANQALRNLGCKDVQLFIPYLLGGRSDRKFSIGGINYLKQVICPIINAQEFTHVTVMDPHSDVIEACLNNFNKMDNFPLVDDALSYIVGENEDFKIALISPDAGAVKKTYDVAKHFGIQNVTTATKIREVTTGTILRTELPTIDLTDVEHIIIIDDICDGGRTFIELAKEIKKQTDKPIYLIVTHGIFSAGFVELRKYFNGIYTTNSVSDINTIDTLLKQLNIF